MADEHGRLNEPLYHSLHLELARGGVGLLFTGHCAVHPRGKYAFGMTNLASDDNLESFSRLTEAVHAEGARMFAQLNHAGSQARARDVEPLAPSRVPNPQHGRVGSAANEDEIAEAIAAFADAARRVRQAGFDGVHLHAGHGYLLSEFLSPLTNLREDRWGGPLENRQRLLREVIGAVRRAVGDGFPVTVKLGIRDFPPGGLTLEDGLGTAVLVAGLGVQAIEITAGLTTSKIESAMPYAGLTRNRALQDKVFHRVLGPRVPEAYFAHEARLVKARVECPVILVGGLRTVKTMDSVVRDGVADFVSLSRPLIREPGLVRAIEGGRRGAVDCVSCNICVMHEGIHSLRCWRKSNRDLAMHAVYRLTGRLH
jgi:2,4-dienoyl-CoA reductase-like NADH-dependent reductase (Old Yellow Enzyme family)